MNTNSNLMFHHKNTVIPPSEHNIDETPEAGDKVTINGTEYRVESVSGNNVTVEPMEEYEARQESEKQRQAEQKEQAKAQVKAEKEAAKAKEEEEEKAKSAHRGHKK